MASPKKLNITANGEEPAARVPLVLDEMSFQDLQKGRLKEIEKRMEAELRKKKREWEKEVERMKEEFLKLYPEDKTWGSEEMLDDPYILRRRGSIDILDRRKMKTMFLEYPESGRRFKLRFNVSDYEPSTVRVNYEHDIIHVTAAKTDTDQDGKDVEVKFCRKVERPSEVDCDKLKSRLTNDGVLIVEAQLPPHTLNFRKHSHSSPSHSSLASSRSRSPSNSPHTPPAPPKVGVPQFMGSPAERRMNLIVELGKCFKPRDVSVQVINHQCIQVKAKHEERSSERFSKNKFLKQYEMSEKIEPYSLRAGLDEQGRLIVGALGKEHDAVTKGPAGKKLVEELAKNTTLCNVLDLATFVPTTPPQ